MPELPEVETVTRALTPVLKGALIQGVSLNRPNLRFPFPVDFKAHLEGTTVLDVRRRAKYICIDLSSDMTLLWHLGMSGRVIIDPLTGEKEPPSHHDHVHFTLQNPSGKTQQHIRYRDPRRFGFMDLVPTLGFQRSKFIQHLGLEPLTDDFNEAYLTQVLKTKSAPIKNVIMDAKIVVGVGNIYASESLFRAGTHPATPAKLIKNHDLLIQCIKDVLEAAILSGGSTLRDHVRPDGNLGYFQHHFFVYGKDGDLCEKCKKAPIKKMTQAGRSTFYCPRCQKAP